MLNVDNEVVEINATHLSFSGIGRQKPKTYVVNLEFFEPIDAENSSWSFGSVGTVKFVLQKAAAREWPRLTAGKESVKNHRVWWEKQEQVRELRRARDALCRVCHRGGVTSLARSANEKFLVSGGEEGDVRVWEIKTRQMVLHLKEHKMAVTALQICDADMCVLSSSRDCSILRWDLTRGERVAALRQRMGGINGIVLQGDGTRLLSVGQDKKVGFWDLRESSVLERLDAGSEQRAIALSPDGRLFATGGADHAVHLWDFDNAMLLARGVGHSGTVRDLMFSPDGKQLVSVADDKNVLIWNVYPDEGGGGGD